jgi:tetratricopeptide (TPR) repeat protein
VNRTLLLCTLLVVGCGSAHRRAANTAVTEGRSYDAAIVWLEVLGDAPDDLRARAALEAAARDACRQKLELARARAAEGRLEEAIAAYRDQIALAQRVQAHGVELPVESVDEELERAVDDLAAHLYAEGTEAFAAGQHLDAVRAWQAVRTLRPDYLDTTAWMVGAWRAQAALDLEANRYDDAVVHLGAAQALSPDEHTAARLAALHAAYGRYWLDAGACHRAAAALATANATIDDVGLDADLERANRCAHRDDPAVPEPAYLAIHPLIPVVPPPAPTTVVDSQIEEPI